MPFLIFGLKMDNCAAERGVVFRVLNGVYNFTVWYLLHGVFLDLKPLKSVKAADGLSTFVAPKMSAKKFVL